MPPKSKPQEKPAASKRKRVEEEEENDDDDDQSGSDDGSSSSGSNSGSDDDSDNDSSDNDSDDDEEQEEEEEPPKKKGRAASVPKAKAKKATKKIAKKVAKAVKKSVKKEKKSSTSSDKKVTKAKSLRKSERLEEARKAYKWWEAPKLSAGINWKYMEHAGIAFAPAYVPHNIPLIYNGKPMTLTGEQEEIASFFAAIPADGPQLGNPKTKPVFEKNFFDDFREALGPSHEIKKFEMCDFSKIKAYLDNQKNLRKAASDEEKAARKLEKEQLLLRYGYALIDGRVEKVSTCLYI